MIDPLTGLSLDLLSFNRRPIRTVSLDGSVWFAAVDVLRALGTLNPSTSTKAYFGNVPDAELRLLSRNWGEGGHPFRVIRHRGLLWFLSRSRRELAPAMRRWIADEILPALLPGFVDDDPLLAKEPKAPKAHPRRRPKAAPKAATGPKPETKPRPPATVRFDSAHIAALAAKAVARMKREGTW